jgi:PKD repeat protein
MKKVGIFIFVFLLIGIISATYYIDDYFIERTYKSGEDTLRGEVSISFLNELSNSILESSVNGEYKTTLTLLELLKADEEAGGDFVYECTPLTCISNYDVTNGIPRESFLLDAGESSLFGFNFAGTITAISDFSIDINSDAGPSNSPQLLIDILNDGEKIWQAHTASGNFNDKIPGCYIRAENRLLADITLTQYCQKFNIPLAPNVKIGAVLVGSGTANVVMSIRHSDWTWGGSCDIQVSSSEEVSCIPEGFIVNEEQDYFVCINAEDSLDINMYKIDSERNNPCGFAGYFQPGVYTRDFEIFVKPGTYGPVGDFTLGDGEMIGIEEDTDIENYLDSAYNSNCPPEGCIIPIKITSMTNDQRINLDAILEYSDNYVSLTADELYDLTETSAADIDADTQSLSIDAGKFAIPSDSGDYTVSLKFKGEEIFSGGITVEEPEPACEDGDCNGEEDCASCPEDCGVCPLNNAPEAILSVTPTSGQVSETIILIELDGTDSDGKEDILAYTIGEDKNNDGDINDGGEVINSSYEPISYEIIFNTDGLKTIYGQVMDSLAIGKSEPIYVYISEPEEPEPEPTPNSLPEAILNVTPTSGQAPLEILIQLDGTDLDGKEDIIQYKIGEDKNNDDDIEDYGEAIKGSLDPINENVIFDTSGTKKIYGQVMDSYGEIGKTGPIYIDVSPGLEPEPEPEPENIFLSTLTAVEFYPTNFTVKTDSNTEIELYEWDFGNGDKDTTITNNVEYTYNAMGSYNLEIRVVHIDNKSATKNFTITVGSMSEIVEYLLQTNKINLDAIQNQITSFSAFEQKVLKEGLDVNAIETALDVAETENANAYTEADYQAILQDLRALKIPEAISLSVETNSILFFPKKTNINIDALTEIARGNYESSKKEIYANSVLLWNVRNVDIILNHREITSSFIDHDEPPLNIFEIEITKKAMSEDDSYIILEKVDGWIFEEDYSEEEISGYFYLPFIEESKKIVFATTEDLNFLDLPLFVSPEISKLSLINFNFNPLDDTRKIKKWILFSLIMLLLVILGLVFWAVLHAWYKKKYENYLFKNKNNLYNLFTWIKNSKKKGLSESKLKRKLRKAGWNSEQLRYVLRKYSSKKTGMPSIPLTKIFKKSKKKKDMNLKTFPWNVQKNKNNTHKKRFYNL